MAEELNKKNAEPEKEGIVTDDTAEQASGGGQNGVGKPGSIEELKRKMGVPTKNTDR